jgi:hypothetical protein
LLRLRKTYTRKGSGNHCAGSEKTLSCAGSAWNGELTFPVSEYTAFFGEPVGRTSRDASGDW